MIFTVVALDAGGVVLMTVAGSFLRKAGGSFMGGTPRKWVTAPDITMADVFQRNQLAAVAEELDAEIIED